MQAPSGFLLFSISENADMHVPARNGLCESESGCTTKPDPPTRNRLGPLLVVKIDRHQHQ